MKNANSEKKRTFSLYNIKRNTIIFEHYTNVCRKVARIFFSNGEETKINWIFKLNFVFKKSLKSNSDIGKGEEVLLLTFFDNFNF